MKPGLGLGMTKGKPPITGADVPDAPTFDPVGGTYSNLPDLSVVMSHTTVGTALYYTIDGSEPTGSSPRELSPYIVHLDYVDAPITLKARAFIDRIWSDVTTATYEYQPELKK